MNNKAIPIFVYSVTSNTLLDLLSSLNLVSENSFIILKLLTIIALVYSATKLVIDYKFENAYFRFTFLLFILYEFITVVRGFTFSSSIWYYLGLITGITFWPFVIPFFVFFDKKISNLALLIKYIYFVSIFFILVNIIFPTLLLSRLTAETIIGIAIPSGFLLLNATYLSNKKVNISFLVLFISLLSVTYLARRNVIVTISAYIIASYFLNIKSISKSFIFRLFPVLIGLLIFIFFSFNKLSTIITNKLDERLTQDTRSELFAMYFIEMQDYMTFGKGMNGSYYYPMPGGETEDGTVYSEEEYRHIIENGYLQLMLTGGIVQIILFLMILLPASIIGIFRSSNNLSKACGIMIFIRLIDMLIYGLPSLSLSYILVWISVGLCYSSSFRSLSDEEIKLEFQKINLA
jgi:hypothetical protein